MTDDTDIRRTATAPVWAEGDRVRGSRFRAHLAPTADPDAAARVVASVRATHDDASHHCWAWRLADGRHRSDDDGEPGGTAGPPILRHLAGADLTDVVCVVTRWFGGTLLGTGGLVRAYGDAAAGAIAAADVVVRRRTTTVVVDHPYDLTNAVAAVLADHAARVITATYGETVRLEVSVPAAAAGEFATAMRDATAGRVQPRGPLDAGSDHEDH